MGGEERLCCLSSISKLNVRWCVRMCMSSMCVLEAERLFMLKRRLIECVHVQRQNVFYVVMTYINSPPWFESIHICQCVKVYLHVYTSSLHFTKTWKRNHTENIKNTEMLFEAVKPRATCHASVCTRLCGLCSLWFSFSVRSVCMLLFLRFSLT